MTRSLVLSPSECWSKTIVVLLCTLAYCNGTCQGIILKICWDCLKLQTAAWLLMLSHEVSECVRKTARHLFFVPLYVTNFREITDVHQCNTQPITYSQCISQPVRICLRWRSKTEGEQILVISAMKHRTSGDVDHETLTFTEFNNEKQHFLTTVFLYIIHMYTYIYRWSYSFGYQFLPVRAASQTCCPLRVGQKDLESWGVGEAVRNG